MNLYVLVVRLLLAQQLGLLSNVGVDARSFREAHKLAIRNVAASTGPLSDDTPSCSCGVCRGKRLATDQPADGYKGFVCKAGDPGYESCSQTGNSDDWVVQTAPVLPVEQFCRYTCKPVIPEALTSSVDCTKLHPGAIKQAQTPSGNGRAFVFHSTPMADSLMISGLDENSGVGAATIPGNVDILTVMRKTFMGASRRRGWLTGKGCHCNCGVVMPTTPPPPRQLTPDELAAAIAAMPTTIPPTTTLGPAPPLMYAVPTLPPPVITPWPSPPGMAPGAAPMGGMMGGMMGMMGGMMPPMMR